MRNADMRNLVPEDWWYAAAVERVSIPAEAIVRIVMRDGKSEVDPYLMDGKQEAYEDVSSGLAGGCFCIIFS